MVAINKDKTIKGLVIIFSLVILDQLIKYLVRHFQPDIGFWIFKISFLKNTGIAFSLFSGYNIFLAGLSFLFIVLFIIFYKYLAKEFGYYAFILIFAGAASNLIDRIFLGYVVDMIGIWRFPVFNIADILITGGAVLILIRYYKEEISNQSK